MTVNIPPGNLAFDLAEAVRHLSERDECLKQLIAELVPFQIDVEDAHLLMKCFWNRLRINRYREKRRQRSLAESKRWVKMGGHRHLKKW